EICEPHMTCYKLVTAEFKWFGLQTFVEALIHKVMRSMMVRFHRQLYSLTDEWYGMDMEKLRLYEDQVAKELEEKRAQQTHSSQSQTQDLNEDSGVAFASEGDLKKENGAE
ncbi:hypothetical protein EV182_005856, partial [Spiromyces aspiralis]